MELVFFWLHLLFSLVSAQSTFTPAKPPSIPLAVRSPFLSTWQPAGSDGGNGGYLAGQWPSFWAGAPVGWTGIIQVDGKSYTWMGNPTPLPTLVKQTAFSYTATRSTFTMDVAGLVTMTIEFLSPITPKDLLRQGMPVSYMNVIVKSADGKKHNVNLYTDISAEWTSGDRNQVAQWSYGTTPAVKQAADGSFANDASSPNVAYHKVWRQDQEVFSSIEDQSSWGYWYYATNAVSGLTYQSGEDITVRGQFTKNGKLANTQDKNYRPINNAYPVFGFSVNLGSISTTPVATLFTINFMQEKAIQFANSAGTQEVPSYWTNSFNNELSAVSFFYNDFSYVSGVSTNMDNRVQQDSVAAGGQNYATLTTLAARQAWGGVKVCGTTSQPLIFMKEISSDGDTNTVDVLFPFQPILLYMNPAWMKLLLDPLFISQEAPGLWPHVYAEHDLGGWPKALGHPDGQDEYMPLEESANMLIMSLAYAQKTGDTGYLSQHYTLLNRWTNWLVTNNSVVPFSQISTDDFAGSLANQTNLAIKAVIAVQAGSLISQMTGHSSDASRYHSVAQSWSKQWQSLGTAASAKPPHTTLNYGNTNSFSLLYNLYADALLNTKIIPTSVYQMQSNFYPTVKQKYGVPLDTRHTYTKNDWQLLVAAIAAPSTRNSLISTLASWVATTPISAPAPDIYDAAGGSWAGDGGPRFRARPVVGGWFSLLALNQTGIPSY